MMLGRTPQGVRGLKLAAYSYGGMGWGSHPARGAWIEIRQWSLVTYAGESHPARGAWIEIRFVCWQDAMAVSHPARGAWIEITVVRRPMLMLCGRTPQGVRGLKSWYFYR